MIMKQEAVSGRCMTVTVVAYLRVQFGKQNIIGQRGEDGWKPIWFVLCLLAVLFSCQIGAIRWIYLDSTTAAAAAIKENQLN